MPWYACTRVWHRSVARCLWWLPSISAGRRKWVGLWTRYDSRAAPSVNLKTCARNIQMLHILSEQSASSFKSPS